jgi:hypothetical protein
MVEEALRELEDLLLGNNYLVDFETVRLPFVHGWTSEQYINAAVGPKPLLTKVTEVVLSDVIREINSYLRYDRDQYSDLMTPPHKTSRFSELLTEVLDGVKRLAAASTSIIRFCRHDLIEWQFSFLFVGPSGAIVFMSWGSD